ncbi:MAG: (2Fe-2S)-binding protein [Candidatus Marinimicrobia bacterium]|nr:(2Fe-2S)-binding protein [Candidatus Neomarinimicrobiota bacterium]|tara:strand:- start:646 stop:1761 length:1116 start_codon:yes stop_codon:yes gene_type:complete
MNYKKTAETLTKGAHTLERQYYIDPNILQKEYDNIFFDNWICVGRSSELVKKGAYKVINIGIESAILLRDNYGNLKAYMNLCRHRGTRICDQISGKFSKSIQCSYHGWTYGLDGKLVGAPHMNNVDGFQKSDFPLFPVAVSEWEGFVFINYSDNPKDFDSFFAPLKDRFKNWTIGELITIETKTYDVSGNWKLVIQNYCECYHCPILHPELAAITPYLSGKNDLYEGPFLGGYMDINQDKDSISTTGHLCCPPLPNLKNDDLKRVYYYSIFPNMLLSLHPEYVMYHTIVPNGVDKCIVTCSWLFSNDVNKSTENNPNKAIEFWDMTNKQDWYISELSQLGIQSKKYTPAPYSGQESLLSAFDQFYLKSNKL